MTIPSTIRQVSYPGAGSVGPYPYTFIVFLSSQLVVTVTNDSTGVVTTLSLGGDYSMTGAGNGHGGTVTLTSALLAGTTLTLQRTVPIVQLTNFRNQGASFPQNIESTDDYSRMIDQQLADAIALLQTTMATIAAEQVTQGTAIAALTSTTTGLTTNVTNLNTSVTNINANLTTINTAITNLTATTVSLQQQINTILQQIAAGIPYIGIANPMTLQGDMIIGGPAPHAGLPTRLPVDAVGKFLVMWGTPPIPTWLYLNLGSIGQATGQPQPLPVKRVPTIYSATGSHTHTVSATCYRIEVELWGAGAGGNASGGTSGGKGASGGGGGYAWCSMAVSPGDTKTVVVGAGGVSANPASSDGEDSTLDATVLVAQGGKTPLFGAQGLPGSFSGSATTKWGATGGYGMATSSSSATALAATLIGGAGAHGGGQGAAGFFVQDHTLNILADGSQTGGAPGGGGYFSTSVGTIDGYDGMVIVWEYQ